MILLNVLAWILGGVAIWIVCGVANLFMALISLEHHRSLPEERQGQWRDLAAGDYGAAVFSLAIVSMLGGPLLTALYLVPLAVYLLSLACTPFWWLCQKANDQIDRVRVDQSPGPEREERESAGIADLPIAGSEAPR